MENADDALTRSVNDLLGDDPVLLLVSQDVGWYSGSQFFLQNNKGLF